MRKEKGRTEAKVRVVENGEKAPSREAVRLAQLLLELIVHALGSALGVGVVAIAVVASKLRLGPLLLILIPVLIVASGVAAGVVKALIAVAASAPADDD